MRKAVFRADQVGSLRRPEELRAARAAHRCGELSLHELREVEDRCIRALLEREAEVGIEVMTDGELRRDAWQTDVSDAVEGFEASYPIRELTLDNGETARVETHSKAVVGRLRQRSRLTGHEVRFLVEHATGPAKVTLPSPHVVGWSSFRAGVTDRVYGDRRALLEDLVPIYAEELRALAREGVAYVQLDMGFSRYLNTPPDELGPLDGAERTMLEDIEIENRCYDALAGSSVVLGSHLCRGSRTRARGTGSYDWIAERLFALLRVDRFLLEYDSPAAGGFAPLRFLPKGKVAVLGLVTSKYGALERADDLKRRIDEAARYCSLDQLALSPQCGFGGSADNDFMSEEEQWRKLELVARVAHEVWGRP